MDSHVCRRSIKMVMEIIHTKYRAVLIPGRVEEGRRRSWKASVLVYIASREHTERKKWPYILPNLGGKRKTVLESLAAAL